MRLYRFAVLLSFALLSGCARDFLSDSLKIDDATYTPVSFEQLSGWDDDSLDKALDAFQRSCPRFARLAPGDLVHTHSVYGTAGAWQQVCQKLALSTPDSAHAFLQENFNLYEQKGPKEGLLTGYYVPTLPASKMRTEVFTVPLYPPPDGLSERSDGAPFYTRAEINAGALTATQPLAYLADPVEAFFMQIQGSGVLSFPDGTRAVYGFAGRNRHAYTPIGRVLVANGALPADGVSKQAIKDWLRAHPAMAQAIMEENASYIFFTEKPEGVTGAALVPLTPERSLAVDPAMIPYGALVWIEAQPHPMYPKSLQRLVVAQDTGAAIKGAARGDLYVGIGARAGEAAGRLQNPARFFVLIPKPRAKES